DDKNFDLPARGRPSTLCGRAGHVRPSFCRAKSWSLWAALSVYRFSPLESVIFGEGQSLLRKIDLTFRFGTGTGPCCKPPGRLVATSLFLRQNSIHVYHNDNTKRFAHAPAACAGGHRRESGGRR